MRIMRKEALKFAKMEKKNSHSKKIKINFFLLERLRDAKDLEGVLSICSSMCMR
jgi:hypothetical protein